jgi:hypothetical protein
MRNLGIIMVVLALVTVGFMAYNVATYEQETLANGPFREGGSLEVHVVPPAEGWEVKLFALDGEKREFARLGTDANGTADFGSVQDEVFRLEATRDNTTVAGNVHAPKNAATVVTLDSNGPAHEWLGEKPAIKAVDWVIIGLFTALVALAVAGGVSLARARNPRLASGGAGAAAAIGLLTGGIALSPIGVGLLVVGIWSLFTVRRNPDLFAK